MKYIVTGCDGQLGSRVAENMLKLEDPSNLIFTCPDLSRLNPERKQRWESLGVTIRQANYDNKDEMIEAFRGGNRIYVVSAVLNGPERVVQHKNVFDASVENGIEHITYTSFFGANRPGYLQYVLPDHTATEAYLREMAHRIGFKYNIMRNNLYMENYLTNSVMLANLSDYIWGSTAGEGAFNPIAKDDSGECAAMLLLGRGEDNREYDLTSDVSVSERTICEMVAERSGMPYRYVPMNAEEFYAYLDNIGVTRKTQGYNGNSPVLWCSDDMVTNEAGIRDGQMAVDSGDVELLLGRKPTHVEALLDRYSYMWEENITHWSQIR